KSFGRGQLSPLHKLSECKASIIWQSLVVVANTALRRMNRNQHGLSSSRKLELRMRAGLGLNCLVRKCLD
ncbi:13335_t:CDS:2, partial [Ambispora leptoticha]